MRPLAQREPAAFLQAVVPPLTGGLHCGMVGEAATEPTVYVVPPLTGGLHCGARISDWLEEPDRSSSRP